MGYDFTIGNAVPTYPAEPGDGFGWTVNAETHPNAPAIAHDAPWSIRGSHRSPSYSVWHDFAASTGLARLFNKTGGERAELIPAYPGVAPLLQSHADEIDAALVAFRSKHPEAVPRFSASMMGDGGDVGEHDAHLARLVWLAWWVRWAVENCKHPAIEAG